MFKLAIIKVFKWKVWMEYQSLEVGVQICGV
jgi:hypothetical protein